MTAPSPVDQGAQHKAEAHQEHQELQGGENALHQRPGRGIAALPLGIRVKPRPDLVLAAKHLHWSFSRARCTPVWRRGEGLQPCPEG